MGRVAAKFEFSATDYVTSHFCALHPTVRDDELRPDGGMAWKPLRF
jgi:hypothetical protein